MDSSQPSSPQWQAGDAQRQTADTRPISVYCPHCRLELQIQPQHAGQVASCPNCNGRFQTPLPQAAAAFQSPGFSCDGQLNPGIKICVLISGIANILFGLLWTLTCYGVFIGVPLIVLAVFEIVYFTQADNKPLQDAVSQAKLLGILEIVSCLFNFFVGLVCGILVLIFACNQKVQYERGY